MLSGTKSTSPESFKALSKEIQFWFSAENMIFEIGFGEIPGDRMTTKHPKSNQTAQQHSAYSGN